MVVVVYVLLMEAVPVCVQIHLNSRGLIFSVGLLLASVFFTVRDKRI